MGTPDSGDENAPTQRIDPAPPTQRGTAGTAATRWVTRVFRPGTKQVSAEAATDVVPPGGVDRSADRTSVLPPESGTAPSAPTPTKATRASAGEGGAQRSPPR